MNFTEAESKTILIEVTWVLTKTFVFRIVMPDVEVIMRQDFMVLRKVFKTLKLMELELLDQFEVTLDEANILCILNERSLTIQNIPHQNGLSIQQTKGLLDELLYKKMIDTERGKKDMRELYYKLTKKGIDTLTSIQASKINLPVISIEDEE